ncbi:MAG: hypothetical protein JWM96_100 [Alphaproteobacteria bacterium]|nr:hypothetical protein [Alphaproteobacteria bacterium]
MLPNNQSVINQSMRVTLEQFLGKLGIDVKLRPYETIPYDYFNPAKGLDVMAEVSLSGNGNMINVEIQLIEHNAKGDMNFRQILQLQLKREQDDIFMATSLRYEGQQLAGKKLNWFEGACRFIKQSMALIKKGTLPDFEGLFKTTIDEAETNAASGGGGGGRGFKNDKPPPAKPGQSGRF